MELSWQVLAVMVAICAVQTGAVNVKIIPKRASVHNNGSVELMCDIGVAANGCVFSVWLTDYFGKKIENLKQIKLENGHASGIFYQPNEDNPLFSAKYQGQGLDQGQCGLKMFRLTPGLYFVGCRVRTATSGWTYDYMALEVHPSIKSEANSQVDLGAMDFERVEVNQALPRRSIDFKLKQSRGKCDLFFKYDTCPEFLGDKTPHTETNKYVEDRTSKTITFPVTFNKVKSGGVMWCLCSEGPNTDYTEFDVKILTVLKRPETPNMTVIKTNYTEGETLTATCVATPARPVARIVWKLGDKDIRNDTDDDNVDEPRLDADVRDLQELKGDWPWRWPWSTKSIKQVLKRPMLTLEDNGKNLTCQVFHPALANDPLLSNSLTITVNPGLKQDNMTDTNGGSNLGIVVGVVLGIVLVALLAGAAIFWMRKKPLAETKANGRNNDRTSFIVDNDLYQSHSGTHLNNRQPPGSRPSYQAENPYDELTPALTNSQPPADSSSRQSAVYNNVVQYAEVLIGQNNGGQPPPRKPSEAEACVYAEVLKDSRPPSKTPLNPDVVYAQVNKGPAGNRPPPKPPVNPEAVYAEVVRKPKR